MATQEQIDGFHRFATEQLSTTGAQLTIDELYDMWRLKHPAPDEYAENVSAINAAIEDFKSGDRGRPAGEVARELREELGISSDE